MARGSSYQVCARIGSVAATYALEHLGGQSHAFTWPEFVARYERHFDRLGGRCPLPPLARSIVVGALPWPVLLGAALWTRIGHADALWSQIVYQAASYLCHQL